MNTKGDRDMLVERLGKSIEDQIMENMAIIHEQTKKAQTDDRSISKLWLDQIEFANVIIVSKAAQLLEKGDSKKLKEIERLLQKLNPKARIVVPSKDKYGDLDVSKELINTGLFDMAVASASAAWAQELEEEHNPETLEYGISSTVFVAKEMPFHPERLHAALQNFGSWVFALRGGKGNSASDNNEAGATKTGAFKGVVRTKGQLWLANSNAFPVNFQTAGTQVDIQPSGVPFLVDYPKNKWEKRQEEMYESKVANGTWSEKW